MRHEAQRPSQQPRSRFRRWLKRFEWLAGIVAALVLFTGGAAFFVLEHPGTLVNAKTFSWLLKRANTPLRKIAWRDLNVQTRSLSFWRKRVLVTLGPTCSTLKDPTGVTRFCFVKAEFGLDYDFKSVIPKVTKLGPIVIRGGDMNILSVKKKPFPKIYLPKYARNARIGTVDVELSKLVYRTRGLRVGGASRTWGHGQRLQSFLRLAAESKGRPLGDGTLRITALSQTALLHGPWKILGQLNAQMKGAGRLALAFASETKPKNHFPYRIQMNYHGKGIFSHAQLTGLATPIRITGELNQDLKLVGRARPKQGISLSPVKAQVRSCRYVLARKGSLATFHARCPVSTVLPPLLPIQDRASSKRAFVPRLDFELLTDLSAPYPIKLDRPMRGQVRMIPRSILEQAVKTQGGAVVRFRAIPDRLPSLLSVSTQVAISSRIPSFSKVVRLLEGTALAVPAPLDSLRGTVHSRLNATFAQVSGQGTLSLKTNLASASKAQILNVDAKARFNTIPHLVRAYARLVLSNVRLALPKLELGALPQFIPDPRLPAKPKPAPKALSAPHRIHLEYAVHVFTPPGHPVRIASNLVTSPVPIDLNLTSTSRKPLLGSLTIEKLPLQVAGIHEKVGKIRIEANTTNSGVLTGKVFLSGRGARKQPIPIPPTQAAGEAAGQAAMTRTPPQFSVPISAIASSILLGTPLNLQTTQPSTAEGAKSFPERQEPGQPTVLQFRHRY